MSLFEDLRDLLDIEWVVGQCSEIKGRKARCVSGQHADNEPSMHLYDDHVHCFACGFHGDVTDVWAAGRGFERPFEAALDLARESGVVVAQEDPDARKRAQRRRQKEEEYLREAEERHQALEHHPAVAQWWQGRGFDEELQERFLLGASKDGTAAVFPFWHRGRVQGLIRRKLEGEPKYLYPKAEDFADGHRPLFIPGPMRAGSFVVEGPIDALAMTALGESAVAVGGADISEYQSQQLQRLPEPLYILPDADAAGIKAGRGWARDFYPRALLCPSEYGEGLKDPADLYQAKGDDAREVLEELKRGTADALDLELSDAPKGKNSLGAYRAAKERILPLLSKLEDEGERDAALHDVASRLKLSIKPLRKALAGLVAEEAEAEEEAPEMENVVPLPGTDRYERAMELLEDRRLLSRAAVDMKRLGHVGELAAKKLAFICAVSARSGKPIQPSTHAQSAAGKNFLWDTALSLFPPEMVVKRSGLSAKALFRTQANLKGAVLYIQEVSGSEDAEYTIRVMQSDGRLEYEATEKAADGSLKNVVYQTEGPTVVVQTTTKNHLHPENETRVFPIYIDESEEQTGRIVSSILKEASGRGPHKEEQEQIQQRWHDAIRLLEPADVEIPYAERIEIPSSPLRIRRDARRLIDVVRVIAWVHQHQRDRSPDGRILATEKDFDEALRLVSESLRRAWQTLTPAEEKVLRTIEGLPEIQRTRNGFKRRELKVKEVSDRRVKEILKSLADTGYLECDGRQGPQGYTYTLVRKAEEISLGISLRPSPDNNESGSSMPNANGRDAVAQYRPVPDKPEEREAGGIGRNEHRPIEVAVLQEEPTTGRTGGEESEEKTSTDHTNGRRLTPEEVEEVKRLIHEGVSPQLARAEVLSYAKEGAT